MTGARSDSSIFIASSSPSTSPSSTCCPSLTCTASTVPGIGEVTLPSETPADAPGPNGSGRVKLCVRPR